MRVARDEVHAVGVQEIPCVGGHLGAPEADDAGGQHLDEGAAGPRVVEDLRMPVDEAGQLRMGENGVELDLLEPVEDGFQELRRRVGEDLDDEVAADPALDQVLDRGGNGEGGADLGGQGRLQREPGFVERLSELGMRLDGLRAGRRPLACVVRGAEHRPDTDGPELVGELERSGRRSWAVVEAGEQMAVRVDHG